MLAKDIRLCLADYYDPKFEVKGDWEDARPLLKIKIERCGCNSAGQLLPSLFAMVIPAVAGILLAR
jgi:hypothetical protein